MTEPPTELWAVRDQAIGVLLELAKSEGADDVIRGQSAEAILVDIREHRAIEDEVGDARAEMNAQIARMESAYIELREAMDAIGG